MDQNSMTEIKKKWFSVSEIAQYLGKSEYYIYKAVREHGMPHGRTSNRPTSSLFFDPDVIDNWIIEQGKLYVSNNKTTKGNG